MAGFEYNGYKNYWLLFKISLALALAGCALLFFSVKKETRDFFVSVPAGRHAGYSYTRLWYDADNTLVGAGQVTTQSGTRLTLERWPEGASSPQTLVVDLGAAAGGTPMWVASSRLQRVAWVSGGAIELRTPFAGKPARANKGDAPLTIRLGPGRVPVGVGFLTDGSMVAAFPDGTVERWEAHSGKPMGVPVHLPLPGVDQAVFRGDDVAVASMKTATAQLFHFHPELGWTLVEDAPLKDTSAQLLLPAPGVMGIATPYGLRFHGQDRSTPGPVRSVHAILYDVIATGDFGGVQVLSTDEVRYELAPAARDSLVAGTTNQLAVSDAAGTTVFRLDVVQRMTARGNRLAWLGGIVVGLAGVLGAIGLLLEGTLVQILMSSVGRQRQLRITKTLEPPDPVLIEYCANGNGVLWAGAGLSAQSGFPLRAAFLQSLIQTASLEGWIEASAARKLTALAAKGDGEEALNQLLAADLEHRLSCLSALSAVYSRLTALSRAHASIGRIGFASAITTNYDLLLENVQESWSENIVTMSSPLAETEFRKGFLLKLWGNIVQPSRLVLTHAEFARASARFRVGERLRTVFQDQTMLFVGCSPEGLLADLQRMGASRRGGRRHFAIAGATGPDWAKHVAALRHQYGIEMQVCSPESIATELPLFLSQLALEVERARREREPANGMHAAWTYSGR